MFNFKLSEFRQLKSEENKMKCFAIKMLFMPIIVIIVFATQFCSGDTLIDGSLSVGTNLTVGDSVIINSNLTVNGTFYIGDLDQKGISKSVHIACRKDGKLGQGTESDPFDGSTQSKFDAIMRGYMTRAETNVAFYLEPGTYFTKGTWDYIPGLSGGAEGFRCLHGWSITGSGRSATTIKLSEYPPNKIGVSSGTCVIGAQYENSDITIKDLTIDASYSDFGSPTNTNTGGIGLGGDRNEVVNVHVKNIGCPIYENCVGIALYCWGAGSHNLVRNCIISDAHGGFGSLIAIYSRNPDSGDNGEFGESSETAVVEGNSIFGDGTQQGIGCWGIFNSKFINNKIVNCGSGFFTDVGFNRGNIIRNNHFLNCGAGVILGGSGNVRGWERYTIADNYFSIRNNGVGIWLLGGVTKSSISGNEFFLADGANEGRGIFVDNRDPEWPSTNNTFVANIFDPNLNNTITSSAGYAVNNIDGTNGSPRGFSQNDLTVLINKSNVFTQSQTFMANVGIGKSNPFGMLDVIGDIYVGSSDAWGRLRIYDDGTQFNLANTTGDRYISLTASGHAVRMGSNTDFVFANNSSILACNGNSYFMAGNIGMGTTNPSERLHVTGNIKADGQFIGNGSGLTNLPASALTGDIDATKVTTGQLPSSVMPNNISVSGYMQVGVGSAQLTNVVFVRSNINFSAVAAGAFSDAVVTVPFNRCNFGDIVSIGLPKSVATNLSAVSEILTWVSGTNLVTLRFSNKGASSIDLPSGLFSIKIEQYN